MSDKPDDKVTEINPCTSGLSCVSHRLKAIDTTVAVTCTACYEY